MAATAIFNFYKNSFRCHRYVPNRSLNVYTILVTIDQIAKKWQHFFEIQDCGGRHHELWLRRRHLEKYTSNPIEPEMNSWFITFNQKCNFYWGILTLKGSLLLGALMLSDFFARTRLSPDFYESQFGGFSDCRPPHSNSEGIKPPKGTCINRNTTFEPLSVQFGPKLRPVGWPWKRKKN